ncbi:arsenite methyltransferase-like [Pomacea canaliculata]|uniref:arsenite methyltransferase-like n=1 Tax=Pomacea canaliculata TaxID=400727 RepID=UPI000D734116|nr:arsenite methyltransferase-like [Pomacea canaliculata]XP_025090658.1 arsenite methyltransferase-like [Pomacea canaliculata]
MCSCAKDTSAVCGENDVISSVKKHYGKDSQTSKCVISGVNTLTCAPSVPKHVREAFAEVHEEVTLRYYGCGSAIPEAVEGCSILDLGSGSGRDCFALSKLVGPSGRVVGVDMTEEQLNCAKTYIDYHTQKFGYSQPNVEFVFGYIEKLGEAGLKEGSFDLIISNCVINLSPDKKSTLREAFRVLKEGGEFYFSDIYTDTVLSEEARKDQFLWGECFSGALLWKELYQLAAEIGFSSPRLVTAKLADTSMYGDKLGSARFTSVTYRLFKLPAQGASNPCRVSYTGGIIGSPDSVVFDYNTLFKKDEEKVVDSELASILKTSRFKQYFSITDAPDATPETKDPKVDPFIAESAAAPKKSCCSKQCC